MKTPIQLVSTKKLSPELLQTLALADLQVVQEDFIRKTIQIPENLDVNSIHSIIVLTSKMGVRAWMEIVNKFGLDITRYTIYCLASSTKTLATQNGLPVADVANDAASLADVILKNRTIDRVSFVCGNLRRNELPDKLRFYGVNVHEIKGYKTEFTPTEMLPGYHGVLFFSPSALDSFQVLNKNTKCVAFCLGRTTAHHAQMVGFSKIQISDRSTPESLVEKVIHFYKTQIIHA